MRVTLLLALLGAGCVGFNSRGPWQQPLADAPGAAPAVAASATTSRAPAWQNIGFTWKGQPLRVTRIGKGPRRVLWIGGIHGNEREGRVATTELPRAFQAIPGATEEVTLIILEDVNPDGSENNTRGNSRGIDLNRNYPAENFKPNRFFGMRPLDQPEARALHDLVLRERPDLVIVAHSWHDDHFINFDGPARHLAERFSELSGYRVKASDDIAPTPGSLGSWIGVTMGIPILTLEYLRGRDAWAAWTETKGAILAVIRTG